MEAITFFDLFDYLIILALVILSFMTYTLIRRRYQNSEDVNSHLTSLIFVSVGIILVALSVILFFNIEKSISSTNIELLKPIVIMTSEPITYFAIFLFLAGCMLSAVGLSGGRTPKS